MRIPRPADFDYPTLAAQVDAWERWARSTVLVLTLDPDDHPRELRTSGGVRRIQPGQSISLPAYEVFEVLGNPLAQGEQRAYQASVVRQVWGYVSRVDTYDVQYAAMMQRLGMKYTPPKMGGDIPKFTVTLPSGEPVEEEWPLYSSGTIEVTEEESDGLSNMGSTPATAASADRGIE